MAGCSQEIEVKDHKGSQQAIQTIETNILALNEKDIDSYLDTITEEAHEQTREATEELFGMEDINFELLESIIIEEEEDKFVIQTEQRAYSESDEYRDHISTNMHTLEKQNNDWKITASEVLDIKFE